MGKKMNKVKKRDKPNDQCETRIISGQDPGQPRKVSISVDQAVIPLQEIKSAINESGGAIQDVGTSKGIDQVRVEDSLQVLQQSVGDPKEDTKQEMATAKRVDQGANQLPALKQATNVPRVPTQEDKLLKNCNPDYSIFNELREAVAPVNSNHIQLERIKLQRFAGDFRKYPEFKEDFEQQIEPKCSMSQRAFVLKHYLSDEVREEVSNVSDDYRAMWRRLDQKYGNVRRLVEMHLAELKGISPNDTSDESVLKMINVVERAHRNLQRLGQHKELYNLTTISII